jgi:hypothetical protein
MFNLGILDVAIGMAMLFLAVSLICSAVRESIETFMKTRAMDLERGVRALLADHDGHGFTKLLFDHPLISGLFPGTYEPSRITKTLLSAGDHRMPLAARRNLPSYIPSGQFASALLDLVVRGPGQLPYPAPPLSIESLRSSVTALGDGQVRRAVLSAIDLGANDLQRVKANLETWFNGTMDRVSGWYRRRTQIVLFAIGLFVAVAMNIDAITIANRLGTDADLRGAVVAAAEHVVNAGATTKDTADTHPVDVANVRRQLTEVGFPIGWVAWRPAPQVQMWCPGADVTTCPQLTFGLRMQILFGWLITAVATVLGAPFWFDVLNKFMVIRSTVKPREKSGEEGSEDRPATPPSPAGAPPAGGPVPPAGGTVPPAGGPVPPAPPTPADYLPNEWNTPGKEQEGML